MSTSKVHKAAFKGPLFSDLKSLCVWLLVTVNTVIRLKKKQVRVTMDCFIVTFYVQLCILRTVETIEDF